MAKQSGFKRGSGCYKCNSCGRSTRATGSNDAEHISLCVQCYELGGIDNLFQDGEGTEAYKVEAQRLYDEIIEKGGVLELPEYLVATEVTEVGDELKALEVRDIEAAEYMTTVEAKKYITKRYGTGVTLFISVGQFASLPETKDRGFSVMANIKVSHTTAMKFIDDAYCGVVSEKARVCIRTYDKCIFIGQAS